MGKDNFWDDEEFIGEIPEGDKVINEVKKCTLKGKEYISVAKKVQTKEGWKYKSNATFKRETFDQIVGLVNNG